MQSFLYHEFTSQYNESMRNLSYEKEHMKLPILQVGILESESLKFNFKYWPFIIKLEIFDIIYFSKIMDDELCMYIW